MTAFKRYVPDLFKGREIVYLRTSQTWYGGDEYIGKKKKAVLIDGDYYDSDGGMYVMGEGHWELWE